MKIIRPLQINFNHQVLEQDRRFYFVASATLGIHLQTAEERLDVHFLKDVFEGMGDNPLPDMGMPKPNGEFLVSGSFYTADGKPVTGGEVMAKLGQTEKRLYVFGPRAWKSGLPSAPQPVTVMPLSYTQAFGGKDYEKNPDGIGFNDGVLPCVEDPGHLVASTKDMPDPAGFGPFYPMLPQRMQYQGTYGADYKKKYFPGYPEDHDWKYFLCAPSDQWIKEYYTGDEDFGLYNMHPDMPSIEGKLPDLYARCFINQIKDDRENFGELLLNLDTIWFFPEKLTGLLIFRGVLEVSDDEAETITHVLCAYEERRKVPRTLDYYLAALEKRRNNNDGLLTNFNTRDLIPEGRPSAMEQLMDAAIESDEDSELTRNMKAKSDGLKQFANEKTEAAIQQVEKNMGNVDIPDEAWEHIPEGAKTHMPGEKGGLDIRKLMEQKPDDPPDPDLELLNTTLENVMPGITKGDPKKLVMKDFSFGKLDEVFDAIDVFAGKKEKQAMATAKIEIDKTKETITSQIKSIDKQIDETKTEMNASDSGEEQIKALEDSKLKLAETLTTLDDLDLDDIKEAKSPLPRVNADQIKTQINMEGIRSQADQIHPRLMEAIQHVQARKAMGIEDEKTKEMQQQIDQMQKQIQDAMEISEQQIEQGLKKAETSLKDGYIMAAHFMDQGLSPHEKSVEAVKAFFLEALSKGEDLSGRDFACIDLSGMNLDGINLAGAYLEQVNFSNTSLKGANLKKAILARAVLDDADLSGSNLKEANVGAVHAHGTNFSSADFTSAKLSKGDFTKADFTAAILDDIEAIEIKIDQADFTKACIPNVHFLQIHISDTKFIDCDINTSGFINCCVENCDFSASMMDKCVFINTALKSCRFEKTGLSNSCFATTDIEAIPMENLNFRGACLKQANFQNMALQYACFIDTNIENAFFGGADLKSANLSRAHAKNTQFRKADLTGAILDHINLDQGSLAKANLANASFKGANLHSVDFLRSNISQTDFSFANLDTTLIENWRPE